VIVACDAADLESFRRLLERDMGWSFDDAKLQQLAEVLVHRSEARKLGARAYLDELEAQVPLSERRALASDLTVPETYFLRNVEQFRAFSEVVLPDRLDARANERRLRILSAGCASGEEPYSLAMVVRDAAIDSRIEVSIRAVDVNPTSIEKASRARFSPWSLRETPAAVRRRWFTEVGSEVTLDPSIRAMVSFEEKNLAADDPDLWAEAAYDVVFCRNVMMYFTPEHAQRLVQRLTRAIGPGGYLFLGHAETLRGLSQDFHLRHTHSTFYYQRHGAAGRPREAWSLGGHPQAPGSLGGHSQSPGSAWPPPPPAPGPAWAATWIETVQRASERINVLAEQSSPPPIPERVARADVAGALDLMKAERFGEALDLLGGPPEASSVDAPVLLLRAVLHAHRGDVGAAETACARLLAIDDLNAGAHYVLALCRESAGDPRGAMEQDQIASYLDPAFAMPRMHLGLLARRAGDRGTASRELERAASLLHTEEPSRLLLFGGGFSRDGLIALCRSELATLGGAR
jgi:chemotaxis protein methyltransferase CheR